VHRARAALATVAALLRAGEAQPLAQRVQQGDPRVDAQSDGAPVQPELHVDEVSGGRVVVRRRRRRQPGQLPGNGHPRRDGGRLAEESAPGQAGFNWIIGRVDVSATCHSDLSAERNGLPPRTHSV
jgi:hypothetical protein